MTTASTVPTDDSLSYADGVVRAWVIATSFWGVVGFLVGVFIAFQLAFPQLNFEWAQGYANFGRLRPLHTSAVIFAFGGNALLMSSFYIVQRTSAVRLWQRRGVQRPRRTRAGRSLKLPEATSTL